nr:helix-hairpin-helix domain-containing protein [Jeotgalicoccus pinnipedialis]
MFFKDKNHPIEVIEHSEIESISAAPTEDELTPEPLSTVFVEVKGAVYNPGVYEVPKDGRVKNVIELARITSDADLALINQAEKLKDEMIIYVPIKGETMPKTISLNDTKTDEEIKVNVNTANEAELMTLNGIGEKKAQTILAYREENGLFMKMEDLLNIPGIGEKTLENLKPYITIGD